MGFIEDIAKYVIKIAPEYNVKVCSPIIAQACLESGYGTSYKATFNNFFGLKYRPNRVTCNSGYFIDGSSEQLPDGSYEDIECKWYSFANMEDGVRGYFQFINISRYDNLHGISDPFEYIKNLKEDDYATSLSYVENLTRLIEQYDLTKYDRKETIMADSSLVIYDRDSNKCNDRMMDIDRITIHCYVGNVTAQQGVDYLCNTERQASTTYVCGTDGIGQMIRENKRPWTSSSEANDTRAITIETACDPFYPYAFRDDVYDRLKELVIDICHRHGKNRIVWIEDKNTALSYQPNDNEFLLTLHRWFAATACPGDWFVNKVNQFVVDVNNMLRGEVEPEQEPESDVLYRVQVGAYSILDNALNMKYRLENDGFATYLVEKNGLYKVQTGAFRNKDNAYNLSTELENKGYDTYITTEAGNPVTVDTSEPEPDIDALARAVIKGEYGNGQARRDALGDLYGAVQKRVNELLS